MHNHTEMIHVMYFTGGKLLHLLQGSIKEDIARFACTNQPAAAHYDPVNYYEINQQDKQS